MLDARKYHHRQVPYIHPDAALEADRPYVLPYGATPCTKVLRAAAPAWSRKRREMRFTDTDLRFVGDERECRRAVVKDVVRVVSLEESCGVVYSLALPTIE